MLRLGDHRPTDVYSRVQGGWASRIRPITDVFRADAGANTTWSLGSRSRVVSVPKAKMGFGPALNDDDGLEILSFGRAA